LELPALLSPRAAPPPEEISKLHNSGAAVASLPDVSSHVLSQGTLPYFCYDDERCRARGAEPRTAMQIKEKRQGRLRSPRRSENILRITTKTCLAKSKRVLLV
jgi:hypothetical protein